MMAARGRPRQTAAEVGAEAAKIINTALAIRYRPDALPDMGFDSVWKARLYVSRWANGQLAGRIRGGAGHWVGSAVQELLYPTKNRTQAAVALVLDHDMTPYRAAKAVKVDLNNLRRALVVGKKQRSIDKSLRTRGGGRMILKTYIWEPGDLYAEEYQFHGEY